MRKLKLQMQVSVDGFVAGPNGELDWMTWTWDDRLKDYVIDLTATIDCILIGRKMADGFITHWASVVADPAHPEYAFGKIMADTSKVVFTKTLEKSSWENTVLAKGGLEAEIAHLKNQPGKDIIVYGGANFVSSLIEKGLIDELHLFVNPTAIGNGLSVFHGRTPLRLVKTNPFDCGVVVLQYAPVQ